MVNKFLKQIILWCKRKTRISHRTNNAIPPTDKFLNVSYAQEGEDLVIDRFLNQKNDGFYIDIGAHHPKRFSNTYRFYQKGWKGINIDAMPGSMRAFRELRPRDINIELGISRHKGSLDYYIFNEPALNTFSKVEAEIKDKLEMYHIKNIISVRTQPLMQVLAEYLPNQQKIDFLSIDVEGMDEEVLRTNDWTLYRPAYLMVEAIGNQDLEGYIENNTMHSYLKDKGYTLVAKTFNTLFYKDLNE